MFLLLLISAKVRESYSLGLGYRDTLNSMDAFGKLVIISSAEQKGKSLSDETEICFSSLTVFLLTVSYGTSIMEGPGKVPACNLAMKTSEKRALPLPCSSSKERHPAACP